MKNLDEVMQSLLKTYTTTLQVSYENVKFASSDGIREILSEAVTGRIL